MSLSIRLAREADATAIQRLTAQLGYGASVAQTRQWLAVLGLEPGRYGVYVAVRQEEVCGWIVVEKRLSLETGFKAEITGLVVSDQHRRLGIGEALVQAAQQWTADSGLDRLVVRSNIQREASHPFYESLGFIRQKTAHNYLKKLA
ncbi:GNAT family N-acetyltransferase [Pokkaliibacter sp. CJK22405]|uniref:GNAT family N-acetyltransferase n=1 Tax=Pokkaliibacter sp. CJK22405 TaxID=3384615 RepID=UPI0039849266